MNVAMETRHINLCQSVLVSNAPGLMQYLRLEIHDFYQSNVVLTLFLILFNLEMFPLQGGLDWTSTANLGIFLSRYSSLIKVTWISRLTYRFMPGTTAIDSVSDWDDKKGNITVVTVIYDTIHRCYKSIVRLTWHTEHCLYIFIYEKFYIVSLHTVLLVDVHFVLKHFDTWCYYNDHCSSR